eukprot:TRINITY_DN9123_c0_g1_i1.p1 TRINITY_DN9123_c0_g1~~TRINITY_DN9123_c0_g1_i1.p1  ORF type:complete len:278 (-),score=92.46 TRINITY_DN9123_c0_g1_i1:37-870(-)
MSRSSSTLSTTSKPPAAAEHKPKKKHRKGKRRGQASSDDEPEPEPVVAASSKLDKKARRADKRATKAGKKALSGGAAEDDGQASDENPFDPARFRELLPAWLQEMDCEEDDEELVALLAELLVPFAGEELARLKESIWSGSVTARRKRQELFVKAFEAAVAQLHLYNKGFAAAGGEVEALELALVKEIGGQLQNEVVLNAAYHAGMDEAEKIESSRELTCLLYTSDAADEEDSVDLGGRRIIKKKKIVQIKRRDLNRKINKMQELNTTTEMKMQMKS